LPCPLPATAPPARPTLALHDALPISERRTYEGCETVLVRPDQSRRTVLCYATPSFDAYGTLLGATTVLIDVTDREERQREALRRSEEHTSELQSRENLVCRLLLEKKK